MKTVFRLAAAFALLASFRLAAAPRPPAADVSYVSAGSAAAQSGFVPARNSGGTLFFSGRTSLRLVPTKPDCFVNGVKVHMCFPAKRRNGNVTVSRLDAQKTFAPLSAQRGGVYRHRVVTITVDPGHGGRDRGAAGRTLREKVATLVLARRVAYLLRNSRYRFRVYLTRDSDSFVPLPERCRIQRRHKSDLFVSIHVNAAVRGDLHGIEVFALTPAGAASTSGGAPSQKIHAGNLMDANNLLLAYSIQSALLRRTGAADRGVKRARFAVLRDITAPGALVEVGFVSNPREEKLLLDAGYREKLARGIAEGIIVYIQALERR